MANAIPRRGKKKHRQPEPDADPEFQIAPMIDILLVLLVFFMSISTTQVMQTNRNIRLAVAKDAKEAKENPGQIIVNLAHNPMSNETGISVKEKNYTTAGEIVPLLQENIRLNPMVRVLIRADRDVRYTAMKSVLEAVGKAGIANVTFSVVDKEASPSAPPSS
ncbi:MAG: biopolymer transporter ExbD [Chthoniobacterales bacterium]|jgi:biopolymer transport protein ExbD|nr:biopolymer transporter ExbD [Chthoniobacterales bacterium]